jgi:hypothetical protein
LKPVGWERFDASLPNSFGDPCICIGKCDLFNKDAFDGLKGLFNTGQAHGMMGSLDLNAGVHCLSIVRLRGVHFWVHAYYERQDAIAKLTGTELCYFSK